MKSSKNFIYYALSLFLFCAPMGVLNSQDLSEEEFQENRLGKQAEKIHDSAVSCGPNAIDQKTGENYYTQCEEAATKLNGMAKVQKWTERTGVAAIATGVGAELLYSDGQKGDLEKTEKLQKLGGNLAVASGATDFVIALRAREKVLKKLKAAKQACEKRTQELESNNQTTGASCNSQDLSTLIENTRKEIRWLARKGALKIGAGIITVEQGRKAGKKARELCSGNGCKPSFVGGSRFISSQQD